LQDSGLLEVLIEEFEEATGYDAKPIAAGTGQLLEMGRRGDIDVLLAHDPEAERAFVDDGFGFNRRLVMHNDFVIVGPPDDPIGMRSAGDATTALHAVRKSEAPFVSRGDDSGTHKLELRLWADLEHDPTSEPWYEETGQGMAATLQVANQRRAYTISDRATFLVHEANLDLEVTFEGDPALLNLYHVIEVNPERHDVHADAAEAFVNFLLSDGTQRLLTDFGLAEYGRPLYTPDGGKTEDVLLNP
jgi:tungstate transport system substrate-binding protein